jgi:ankyrin repeat protein
MLVDVGEWAGTSIQERGRKNESSPPHVAVSCGKEPVVNLLLSNVADVSAKNIAGLTPLQCAAAQGREGVLLLIQEAEVNPPAAPSPAHLGSFL